MGKKPIVSVTYENERISVKNSLPFKMFVTSLLYGPRADLWPFYGFLRKRFSLYIKVIPLYRGIYKRFSLYIKVIPLYREKTPYIKTHKLAINRPVDHTGET